MILTTWAPSARLWRRVVGRYTRTEGRVVILYSGGVAVAIAPQGVRILPARPARRRPA